MRPPLPVMRWSAVLFLLFTSVASATERTPVEIANACASCHGPDGRSQGAIPSLAGMPAETFVARMEEFRAGGGQATIMDRIAPGFSPAETRRLADYFADLR